MHYVYYLRNMSVKIRIYKLFTNIKKDFRYETIVIEQSANKMSRTVMGLFTG